MTDISLYDFIKIARRDYDCYDTEIDDSVTVCYFDEEDEKDTDFYTQFSIGILKFVTMKACVPRSDCELVADWYGFIDRNFEVFVDFASKNWDCDDSDIKSWYSCRADFIADWIRELDSFEAGGTTDSVYKDFVENYMPRLK